VASTRSLAAPDAPARTPEVWAVIVAIESYDDDNIPGCPGAIRDGTALARWFTATAQWSNPHVLLMNDNGEEKHGRPQDLLPSLRPTRENLDWALKQWLGHRLQPGDIGVVYFAGQSAVLDDCEVLLPIDAEADDLAHSGWTPEEAVDELAPRKQASLCLWIDAASPLRELADGRPSTDQAPAVTLLHQLTRWPGVSAWMAHSRPTATTAGVGPFLAALARGLGDRPNNLLACLEQLQQDPALKAAGFRVRGGVSPLVALWPDELLPDHKFKPSLLLQQGHADAVTTLVVSADGEQMITGSMDSTIRIWRVRDGAPVLFRLLAYHTNGVTALALSPNGRYLASGDGMGQVRVWDLAEGRERPQEGGSPHNRGITAIGFLPGDTRARFVALDQAGQSTLWDATGAILQKKELLALELVRMAVAVQEGPVAVALADPGGELILVGGDGKTLRSISAPGGRPTALHLSPDGRWLAAGDENGRVRVWNSETGALLLDHNYNDRIGALRFGPAGGLAVAAGDRMYLAPLDAKASGPGLVLEGVADVVVSALFSADGNWLAAVTNSGHRHLWTVRDRSRPQPRPLPIDGRSPGVTCMAFDRDMQWIGAGEGDGGVRRWDLARRRERPRIPPHRGKVDGLSVSADGRFLLQITHDAQALVWDLKEGRGARTLPGRWTAGAFVPRSTRLVMTRDANHGGDVVLIDRETGGARLQLERPPLRNGNGVSKATFARVAVSQDGRKIAAATAPGQVEMVCVWDVEGGQPRVFRGHSRPITAVSFSGDGRSLLTASEDGTAKLWDLAAEPAASAPALVLSTVPAPARPITAAQINPANRRWIVTAHWSPGTLGQLILWDAQPGQPPRPRTLGEMMGRPYSVLFSPDGRWVGAAGQDKAVHLWALADGKTPERVAFEPEHQHTEQVKALVAGPTTEMIASGGDDTTIKLWTLDAKTHQASLLGTLVGIPAEPEEEVTKNRLVDAPTRADWLAFTPEGLYDSSLEGDRLVSFVLENQVRPLEQYAEQFHKFQLTDDLRLGARPQAPLHTAPPALAIDPPPAPDVANREADLKVTVADPALNIEELRLYQDGVPVQAASDLRRLDDRGHYAARVRLRPGVNRFYAMAGRPGDIDARSENVEVRYDGPEPQGRLHVLALGVKDYSRNALRFASLDAQQLADHLHQNGIEGVEESGQKIVLTDGDVSERSVQDAFTTLRREVKGRPEDVVVVFLAGHTDVLKDTGGKERFSLLLKPFPFPENAPLIAMNRGVGVAALNQQLPPGADLPFHLIYRGMSRLESLQRLVIIDACQAEAIFNDPGVRRIEQALERDTRRARTSYLLAARRGEAANESALLEHGLLTYVLLRGMQAPGLRPLPIRLAPFDEIPSADRDGDGYVTSLELREYTDKTLPILASRLPDLVQRAGPAPPVAPAGQALHLQGSEGSGFRLISLRNK
jgi:WD40 repeat protein